MSAPVEAVELQLPSGVFCRRYFMIVLGKTMNEKWPPYISPDRRLWTQCNAKLYAVLRDVSGLRDTRIYVDCYVAGLGLTLLA